MMIYTKRLGPSASQQAGSCAGADAARCTNCAMYDVFSNGVHVIYYKIGCNTTQRGQGQVLLSRLVMMLGLETQTKPTNRPWMI